MLLGHGPKPVSHALGSSGGNVSPSVITKPPSAVAAIVCEPVTSAGVNVHSSAPVSAASAFTNAASDQPMTSTSPLLAIATSSTESVTTPSDSNASHSVLPSASTATAHA